jgi:hypothetical protein
MLSWHRKHLQKLTVAACEEVVVVSAEKMLIWFSLDYKTCVSPALPSTLPSLKCNLQHLRHLTNHTLSTRLLCQD